MLNCFQSKWKNNGGSGHILEGVVGEAFGTTTYDATAVKWGDTGFGGDWDMVMDRRWRKNKASMAGEVDCHLPHHATRLTQVPSFY